MVERTDQMMSVGDAASLACLWEATARKAGNVTRFHDFADLTYPDFLLSAWAIRPVFEHAQHLSIGALILQAIQATKRVVHTNSNLGIVLLLGPLAKMQDPNNPAELQQLLAHTTVADCENLYTAIQLAVPGGMGKVDAQDIAEKPTVTLLEAMHLAKERDAIAMAYASNFESIFDYVQTGFTQRLNSTESIEELIVACQLDWLSAQQDTLIERKCGRAMAEEATRFAQDVLFGHRPIAALDTFLRADGHRRNPGTTADFVTASLFLALRQNRINNSLPFSWKQMPVWLKRLRSDLPSA